VGLTRYQPFGPIQITTTTWSSHSDLLASAGSGFRHVLKELKIANLGGSASIFELLSVNGATGGTTTSLSTLCQIPVAALPGWNGWEPPGGEYVTPVRALRGRAAATANLWVTGLYMKVRSP